MSYDFHVRYDVKEPLPVCMSVCMSHNQIIRLEDEKVNFKENLLLINK